MNGSTATLNTGATIVIIINILVWLFLLVYYGIEYIDTRRKEEG